MADDFAADLRNEVLAIIGYRQLCNFVRKSLVGQFKRLRC